jgi:lactate racemase
VAGHVKAAHRQGCELVARRGTVPIPGRADIVVVSAGGYPSDLNMYQAQKALDNASHAVREGGIVIWVAECSERLGNQTFESWLLDADTPDQILERIQREFVLGGHKAAAMASVMQQARIYLVSGLPDDLVRDCGLVPHGDLPTAFDVARKELGAGASVIVLPQGGSVMPVVG